MGRNRVHQAVATASYRIGPARAKNFKKNFANHVAKEIKNKELGAADTVFGFTGAESCCNISINCAALGGKVVLVGMGSPT